MYSNRLNLRTELTSTLHRQTLQCMLFSDTNSYHLTLPVRRCSSQAYGAAFFSFGLRQIFLVTSMSQEAYLTSPLPMPPDVSRSLTYHHEVITCRGSKWKIIGGGGSNIWWQRSCTRRLAVSLRAAHRRSAADDNPSANIRAADNKSPAGVLPELRSFPR